MQTPVRLNELVTCKVKQEEDHGFVFALAVDDTILIMLVTKAKSHRHADLVAMFHLVSLQINWASGKDIKRPSNRFARERRCRLVIKKVNWPHKRYGDNWK